MEFEIRKFTKEGSREFAKILSSREAGIFKALENLCQSDTFTERTGEIATWDDSISSRLGLAEFLWPHFGIGAPLARLADDPLLWDWMACRLFAVLHGNDESVVTSNKAKSESNVRWIVEQSKLRQHRHLILGPFTAYKLNVNDGTEYLDSQLVQDILTPGEVVERISGKIQLAHGEVAKLTTWLYVDKKEKKIRSGITSEGSPQLLSKYFNQIEKTVEYQQMDAHELLGMLPTAFEKWVKLAKADYGI